MRQALNWFGVVMGCLFLCLVALFITFEWWAKVVIAHQASAAMGHQVTLKGPMDVAWSWDPRMTLDDIYVANTSWSPEPFMAIISRLSFRIHLRQLIQGKVILFQIELLEPILRLESSETGRPNWIWTADSSEQPPEQSTDEIALPTVKDVVMHHSRLSYQDYSTDHKTTFTLTELRAETRGPEEEITIKGTGAWEARPFQLALQGGSLAALQAREAPYPVRAQLQLDPWSLVLEGTLLRALELAGVDLEVNLEGALKHDPKESPQPLYRLTGHLTRQHEVWVLDALQAAVGQNHLTGRAIATMREKRPFFHVELSTPALDVDNLMAVVAGPPNPTQQKTRPSDVDASSPAIKWQVTRAVNGILKFQSKTVKLANQTLNNLQTEGRLENGHLTLTPNFDIAGGSIRATIEIEDRNGPLESAIKAQMQQINVEQLLANIGKPLKSAGILQGDVDLHGTGRTLSQLLESLAGNLSLGMTDQADDTDVEVQFATSTDTNPQTQSERGVKMTGEGRIRGEPVEIQGQVGSVHAFYQGSTAYPIQAHIQLGQTQARLDGTVKDPRRLTGLQAKFAFSGPDPATLSQLFPLDLPHLPAYELEGDVQHEGHTLTVKTFKGSMGHSDLEGTLTLDMGTEPVSLRGKLHSQRLQLDEVTSKPSSTSQDQKKEEAPKKVIPDMSMEPDLLRRLNADVYFDGKRILGLGSEMRDVSVALKLNDSELMVHPNFGLGGGRVKAEIDLVGRSDPIKGFVKATLDDINLSEVLEELVRTPTAFGRLKGHIALTGRGNALPTFLKSVDGDVSLSMAGGRFDSLMVELVGLDVGEAIVAAFTDKNDTVQLHCLIVDFIVSNGKMQTQVMVLDTSDTQVEGKGFVDLGQQTLNLQLVPRAKDFSLFSVESPLYIKGTFSEISISPKFSEVLLSLATPIKPGTTGDADCQHLLQAVQQ